MKERGLWCAESAKHWPLFCCRWTTVRWATSSRAWQPQGALDVLTNIIVSFVSALMGSRVWWLQYACGGIEWCYSALPVTSMFAALVDCSHLAARAEISAHAHPYGTSLPALMCQARDPASDPA